MADQNHNSLQFDGYIIESGTVLLSETGAEPASIRININELVNRQDLIDRLPPEEALRLGSWHAAYIDRKYRRQPSTEAESKSYRVAIDVEHASAMVRGEALSGEFSEPGPAVEACKKIRTQYPGAYVLESTRYF
jgi:hypothetical protein